MAFSSIPAYLDPSNWQQQQNHQIIIGSSGPPPPPHGSIRVGSMAERARIANVPLPETALKCPRCESTNTKFCYFNNYSLSQPRHFCKTCRRYWTRGGALRNVPVGGGCRRNKRTKSSATTSDRAHQPNNNNNNNNNNSNKNPSSVDPTTTAAADMLGLTPLNESFSAAAAGDHVGLGSYGGMPEEMSFPGGGVEPWRMQQFPFQDQFGCGESSIMGGGQAGGPKFSSSMLSQLSSIKMEERTALNLSRQLFGNTVPQQWNNNPNTVNWTDLSNFSPSSTGNHL